MLCDLRGTHLYRGFQQPGQYVKNNGLLVAFETSFMRCVMTVISSNISFF